MPRPAFAVLRVSWMAALTGWLLAGSALAGQRPLTVDDVLRMEDIGRVAIDVYGRRIVAERMAAYDESPARAQADRRTRARIYATRFDRTVDWQPLFPQEPSGGYWMGDLSPDGSRVAIFWTLDGRVHAGVFDFSANRLTSFAFTPNYFWLVQTPLWLTNADLVYAAMPDGEQPGLHYKAGIARKLNQLWEKSFQGIEPSATVLNSTALGTGAANQFRRGKLLRVNANTGEFVELSDGYFYNMRRSRSGRYLAVLKEGGAVQPQPATAVLDPSDIRRLLVIYDLWSGQSLVPCPHCNVGLGSLEWARDRDELAFYAWPIGEASDRGTLWSYGPGNVPQPIATPGLELAPDFIWQRPMRAIGIGGAFAVYARSRGGESRSVKQTAATQAGGRYDWFLVGGTGPPRNLTASLRAVSQFLAGAVKGALFVVADGQVWRVGARTKPRRLIHLKSEESSLWGSGIEAAAESDETRYTGSVLPDRFATLAAGGDAILIDLQRAQYSVLDHAQDQGRIVAASLPAELVVVRRAFNGETNLDMHVAGREPVPLLRINQHLRDVAIASQVQLTYSVAGVESASCLLMPIGGAPRKPFPVVVHVYPGLRGACRNRSVSEFDPDNLQLLAARGYGVLFASAPLQTIRTREGPTQGLTAAVLAAVDRAIEEGFADPERLGLYGMSQGSHGVLQILTQTSRFKAAVSSHGISDFASQYGAIPLYARLLEDSFGIGNAARFENPTSMNWLGATPWQDPERYMRNSPIFFADRIQTPLLLIHSDFDQFALGQSEEIFSALYRLRKEAAYVTYWGEGHGNLSPANIRDVWARIFDWYDRYLNRVDAAATPQ